MSIPKIIVLTPVKNEAWILDRFLGVTSRFADAILIADQQSTDNSREIAARYKKAVWIENPGRSYDEASRQQLLIDEARRRWSLPVIFLALDADEILAADAVQHSDWQAMLAAPRGTVLLFEKPDLLPGVDRCLRYPGNPVALGFVDDGTAPHRARHIHSPRLPQPEAAPRLRCDGIKFLHYGLTRPKVQMAKVLYYAVQENLAATSPVYRRRNYYGAFRRNLAAQIERGAEPAPDVWFDAWESSGIDMKTVHEDALPWQEIEVLRAFAQHGERRFWLDPIWEHDWEAGRAEAQRRGLPGLPVRPIAGPPLTHRVFAECLARGVALARIAFARGRKAAS